MGERSYKPLTIEQRQAGQAVVVRICGSVPMDDADKLYATLQPLADRKVAVIVLDLRELDFICSTGLGAIISAHVSSRYHDGEIRLAGPQPAVRKLLEMTRLVKLFPIYDSVDDALAV